MPGYEGVLALEWGVRADASPASPLLGWTISATEVLSGRRITTISSLVIKAPANGIVTAEAIMFADQDGRPVYDGSPQLDEENQLRQGAFPFVVSSLTTSQPPADALSRSEVHTPCGSSPGS